MPISNRKEEIDIRILRLIGLEDVFDLDYETYLTLLKEVMVKSRMSKKTIPTEEIMLLTDEYKRVKSKKDSGRFEVKKKKITAGSFSVGSIRGKITGAKAVKSLPGSIVGASPLSKTLEDNISAITSSVISIAETLKQQKKISDDASAYDKRKGEQEKRGLRESNLEKRFEGLKKAAENIIAPVKSLLDRIIQFFTTVILGRIVYKLIEWFGDPNNANKVKSIIRFLGDWGPALLGGFILFGTKFGKGVRILTNIALSGIAKLAKAIPTLLRFAKGNPKTAAAVAVGTYAATQLAQRAFSGEEQKVEQRAGGGVISVPRFSGGGINFSGMFGDSRNFFNGLVTGEKGVDKIPAWLSDGEFVVSAGAVRKYGVETFESMNAAGGGTNRPTFKNETVYAQGGGYMGDYMSGQVKLRPASIRERAGDSQSLKNLLGVKTNEEAARIVRNAGNKVPDVKALLGNAEFSRFEQGHFNKFSEGADEKTFKGLRRIYQQHFGVGEEFSKMMSDRVDAEMLRRSARQTSAPKPKPKITRIDPRRMLPSAGESSSNAMRAASRVRSPIPATSSIVPYTGGGLARTGVTAGLSVPQIRTNMRVPGGFGNLKSFGVELLLSYLLQSGLDYVEAKRLASSIEKARKESPEKLANRIEKLRELVDKEERFQKSFGGILQKVIKLGGETGSERLSRQAKTILSGLGAKTFQGGSIKGGYGLKDQSFKDAPKTQIMTDDKGKPFVGYKAMRNGKIVYVRGPQAGMGTSNPFEMLGRMINPGAYKDIDAANAKRKYQEASAGSISSLRERGASKATIAKRQSELNKRKPVKPPTKPKPKVVVAGGGMNGGRGSGSKPSTSRPPSFSATNNSKPKINILGIRI